MATATIMMGVPGSGKTTWVKQNIASAVYLSADVFHEDADGVYRFKPEILADAHAACLRMFIDACRNEYDVVIDNTNVDFPSIAPYIAIAQAYGLTVQPIWVKSASGKAFERQTHNVPKKVWDSMHARIEKMFREWPAGRWPPIKIVYTD